MNMSRFSKVLVLIAAAAFAAACTPGAKISGTIESAPSSEVIVKLLNINRYEVLDTVATDAAGKFSCKVEIAEGQPEFVYLFYKDRQIASLLLEKGDKVGVTADTLGNYEVTGSEESLKLAQVEKDYSAALMALADAATKLQEAKGDEATAARRELNKIYIDYYRDRVKYVLTNSKSLTAVPVLYQNFGTDLPVFGQSTDAIHFVNTADSLATVYPRSKYVRTLRKEAERRFGYMELETLLKDAPVVSYPEIELPDINSNKIKLSEVEGKVIMIHFWDPTDPAQKMFNVDMLMSFYNDYHKQGFEIYQVGITTDKVQWAQAVKQQNLPWINVCDGLGGASPYITAYGLSVLPTTLILADGELVDGMAVDEKALRSIIRKHLR